MTVDSWALLVITGDEFSWSLLLTTKLSSIQNKSRPCYLASNDFTYSLESNHDSNDGIPVATGEPYDHITRRCWSGGRGMAMANRLVQDPRSLLLTILDRHRII